MRDTDEEVTPSGEKVQSRRDFLREGGQTLYQFALASGGALAERFIGGQEGKPVWYAPAMEKIWTPGKHEGLVLSPSFEKGSFDSHLVDCPFVFAHDDRYYMTFIGWDGIGYRTGLASSDDLINWKKERILIDRGPKGSTTENNIALAWILRDNDLFGSGQLKKVNGRYLGTYHAYSESGYEAGPAPIGLCWSDDLRHWEVEDPILRASDPDHGDWEALTLYKSCIVEHDGLYFLFYNANNGQAWPWKEQIGVALSTDLKKWRRGKDNPIVPHGPEGSLDHLFVGDPCVVRVGDAWAMFHCALGDDKNPHARETVAFSKDLLHWEKSETALIDIGPEGSFDSIHAHKPGVIARDGKLYHFYCAVGPLNGRPTGDVDVSEMRGIAVAVS